MSAYQFWVNEKVIRINGNDYWLCMLSILNK